MDERSSFIVVNTRIAIKALEEKLIFALVTVEDTSIIIVVNTRIAIKARKEIRIFALVMVEDIDVSILDVILALEETQTFALGTVEDIDVHRARYGVFSAKGHCAMYAVRGSA